MLVDTVFFLFESLKGRESSGKSSLINALLGRKACPVASVPGSTANARIHTMTLGNTLFEFCDVPGRGLSLIIYQILLPIKVIRRRPLIPSLRRKRYNNTRWHR